MKEKESECVIMHGNDAKRERERALEIDVKKSTLEWMWGHDLND